MGHTHARTSSKEAQCRVALLSGSNEQRAHPQTLHQPVPVPPLGQSSAETYIVETSGRGSAWLERCVRDAEVGGSNPLAPTVFS